MTLEGIKDIVNRLQPSPQAMLVRVLIVDNDPVIREIWRQMLLTLDVKVVCAGATREAIEEIDEGADILLLDWKLDRTNGSSVLDRWVRTKRGPAIVISGYIEEIDVGELYLRGARNVLAKPIQIATLRAIIMWYRRYVLTENGLQEMRIKTARLERTVLILVLLFASFEGPRAIEWVAKLMM